MPDDVVRDAFPRLAPGIDVVDDGACTDVVVDVSQRGVSVALDGRDLAEALVAVDRAHLADDARALVGAPLHDALPRLADLLDAVLSAAAGGPGPR